MIFPIFPSESATLKKKQKTDVFFQIFFNCKSISGWGRDCRNVLEIAGCRDSPLQRATEVFASDTRLVEGVLLCLPTTAPLLLRPAPLD